MIRLSSQSKIEKKNYFKSCIEFVIEFEHQSKISKKNDLDKNTFKSSKRESSEKKERQLNATHSSGMPTQLQLFWEGLKLIETVFEYKLN